MAETNGTSKIPSGTAEGLMEFFDFLIAKGYATPSAAGPLKSAARQVLMTVEGDEFGGFAVKDLDADAYLDRFEKMVVGQYKHESLQAYRNRFKRGLASYESYLADGKVPSIGGTMRKRTTTDRATTKTTTGVTTEPVMIPPSTADRLIDYPFPLRSGQIAMLRLPVKLDKTDAERMGSFIRTLVLEPQRELTRGDSVEEA